MLLRYVIEESYEGGPFKEAILYHRFRDTPMPMFFDVSDEARDSAYAQVKAIFRYHFPGSRITQDGHTLMTGDGYHAWRARVEEVKEINYG